MLKYLYLLLFSLFMMPVFAQNLGCGTVHTPEMMQAFYQRDKSHLQNWNKATNDLVVIPVIYHLAARDNGLGAFSLADTYQLHCSLNEDYADADIYFYIYDIVYHNNDYYYYMEDDNAGNTMFQQENNRDVCNIYIVKDAKSGTTPVCGYSYLASYGGFLNRNGIVLDQECSGAGSTTLTHEMGHYLNLPHTFSGWEGSDYGLSPIPTNEWERVDGSNCNFTADGFCDTPPDYISERWNCTNNITLDDAIGTSFVLDEKNYMSYSSDACQEYFSPMQRAEVNAAPAQYRSYLLSLTAPDISPINATQARFPQNNEVNLSPQSVVFSWDMVPGATKYLFELTKTNFNNPVLEQVVSNDSLILTNLDLNTDYKWRVKPISAGYACADYTTVSNFKTATFNLTTQAQDVKCPNDINGSVMVNASVTTTAHDWYIFNNTTSTFDLVNITVAANLTNLAPGFYKVEATATNSQKAFTYFTINDAVPLDLSLNISGNSIYSAVTGGAQPYTYTWSNAQTSINNTQPVSGQNTLYIVDANGCFKSETITYTADVSAIDALNENFNVRFFPNPLVENILFVTLETQQAEKLMINLYNVQGSKLMTQQIDVNAGENTLQIPFTALPKGVYIVQLTVNKQHLSHKIMNL